MAGTSPAMTMRTTWNHIYASATQVGVSTMTDRPGAVETMRVRCCIAGGGPAGMMLGFLLARAGVEVVVLEKHADFFRDFRGDTIHPSTLEVMHELGLLAQFLERPHQEVRELHGWVGDARLTVADFSRLPTRCKFIAFMPQWDFLDFLARHAKRYPTFRLRMQAEVTDLIAEDGRIAGVRARTPAGQIDVRADLTIGADGRHSTVRARAGLEVIDLGAPMDVLWMKLAQRAGDPKESLGRFEAGRILVLIDRGDYWQIAFVIPKGSFEDIRGRGYPRSFPSGSRRRFASNRRDRSAPGCGRRRSGRGSPSDRPRAGQASSTARPWARRDRSPRDPPWRARSNGARRPRW